MDPDNVDEYPFMFPGGSEVFGVGFPREVSYRESFPEFRELDRFGSCIFFGLKNGVVLFLKFWELIFF